MEEQGTIQLERPEGEANMIFSHLFLSLLVYGSLLWCGIASVALLVIFVKEWKGKNLW